MRDLRSTSSLFLSRQDEDDPITAITGLSVSVLSARLITRARLRDRVASSSDVYQ